MVPRPWAQVKVFSLHIAFHPLILGAQGKKAKRRHLIKGDVSFPGTSIRLMSKQYNHRKQNEYFLLPVHRKYVYFYKYPTKMEVVMASLRLTIRLKTSDESEAWLMAAESQGYSTLNKFIRTVVNKAIHDVNANPWCCRRLQGCRCTQSLQNQMCD